MHTNDRRFVCDVCSKAFTRKSVLSNHQKRHDRERDTRDELSEIHQVRRLVFDKTKGVQCV